MSEPAVSVVMPVYNAERYLEEAVSSVLTQTFTDLELLTVDDGSTDSTPRILERLATQDSRLRIFRCVHRGIVPTVLYGSRHARGAFIARMDADDVSLPQRLERQLAALESRPELGAVGTWVRYVDEDGTDRGDWRTPVGSALVSWSLQFGTALANPTVVLRREVYKSVGGDREQYQYAHDYDLWLRLAQHTQLDNVPEHLLLRRVHLASDSMRNPEGYELQTLELALMSVRERFAVENAAGGMEAMRSVLTSGLAADERVLREAADFVERLLRRYRAVVPLTRTDARTIRLDAADRINDLARLAQNRDRALALRLSLRSLRWRYLG